MARKAGFFLALCGAFVVMTAAECVGPFCEEFPQICEQGGEIVAIETEQPALAVDEEATTDLAEAEPDPIGS